MSMNNYYHFDPALLTDIRKRFNFHLWEGKDIRPITLHEHPEQWANVLMEMNSEDQKTLLFRLLGKCPNGEWIDRGVDKAIKLLTGSKVGPLLVTGIQIRNLYWLHTAAKTENRHSEEYHYTTITLMAYVLVAWEVLQLKAEACVGYTYHYPERL